MRKRKINHDWAGQIGGTFKCSVCRLTLTDQSLNTPCVGTKYRFDNEHVSFGEPIRNIGQQIDAVNPDIKQQLRLTLLGHE